MSTALTYAIIDIADLSNVDFGQVNQTSQDTIRKSLDETKFVLKWSVEPSFITDGTITPLQTLSHTEVLSLMDSNDWKFEETEIEG